MPVDLAAFPDVEVALLQLVNDLAPHNGTVTPPNLQQQLEFIQVHVFGGTDDLVTDFARADVHVFGAKRTQTRDLAEAVRQRFISGPHVVDVALLDEFPSGQTEPGASLYPQGGVRVVIDRITTVTRPFESPWPDPHIHRFTASYRTHTRR